MWKPIETAPKDGSWIGAWRKHATRMRMVRWDDTYSGWEDDDGIHFDALTHWMPLPPPPTEGGE